MIRNDTNIENKSQLAKLLATENIEVQENDVETASFDVKNRVLTIPTFEEKKKSKYVYDMLVGHEVAHALWTPADSWEKCADQSQEFKSFVNVLEDCRIDKKIQKRYPGLTNDYIKGFTKLLKDNFFKTEGKKLNDYMIIDKINLYYKSSKKLNITFDKQEKQFIDLVDNLKTFEDVKDLATKILGWTKDKIKKTPDFDKHIQSDMYVKKSKDKKEDKDGEKSSSDNSKELPKKMDDKLREYLKKKEEEDSKNGFQKDDKKEEDNKTPGTFSNGAGGDVDLSSITDSSFQEKMKSMIDKNASTKDYLVLPKVNLKNLIIPYKEYLSDNIKYYNTESRKHKEPGVKTHKDIFDKFIKESHGCVNYMVKEFEMKKNARLHARAATSKTGIIDPMKLHSYKFAEDIFKKITILPNEKNHGMIMLLDWSGSMSRDLLSTVEQLINLVMFTKKINIPFTVYKFLNHNSYTSAGIFSKSGSKVDSAKEKFSQRFNDAPWDQTTNLVELFTHRQTKKEYLKVAEILHKHAYYWAHRNRYDDKVEYIPSPLQEYYLSSTPLNESLVAMDAIITKFKNQYKTDKVALITLTDGSANSVRSSGTPFLKLGRNYVECEGYYGRSDKKNTDMTSRLITYLKKKHGIQAVGFYLVSKYNQLRHRLEIPYAKQLLAKTMFRKDKVIPDLKTAYDVYFYVNAGARIDNKPISDIVATANKAQLKRDFAKGMKKRLTSRVLLNKFIEKVA